MAFSNTVVDIIPLSGGYIMEFGTFSLASVTTGTITAATTGSYTADGQYISTIVQWGFASDGDNAVSPAKDVNPNQVKITGTSNDTGDYWIVGKAV